MKFIDKLRKLPDDKKTTFAIVVALFFTIIIAFFWFAFGPKKTDNGQGLSKSFEDPRINSIKESIQKSFDEFNAIKDQIYGTTSTSTMSTTTSTTTVKEDIVDRI